MMKFSRLASAGLLALGLASPCRAGKGGGEPFDFLFLDANARSVAMGGAYSALANDSNALLYNPAGLGMLNRHEATFMHNQYLQGMIQDYVGVALRQGYGVNLNLVRFPDAKRTTYDNPDGDGSLFGSNDMAVAAGYGRRLTNYISLGGAFKYIRESIDSQSNNAYAFDVGTMLVPPWLPELTLSLAAQNIGPDAKYQKISNNPGRERLPLNVRGGAAVKFKYWDMDHTVAVDLSKERSADAVGGVGVESVIYKAFALRLGFNSRNNAGLGISAGVGWITQYSSLDYAIVPYGDLGLAHRASFTVRWGKEMENKPVLVRDPETRKISAWTPLTPAAHSRDQAEAHGPAAEQYFDQADRAVNLMQWQLAQNNLDKAAGAMPENDSRKLRYYERMGYISYQQKDILKSKEMYLVGIKLAASLGLSDPLAGEMYAGLGFCLVEQNNISYAVKFFEKAKTMNISPKTRTLVEAELNAIEAAR